MALSFQDKITPVQNNPNSSGLSFADKITQVESPTSTATPNFWGSLISNPIVNQAKAGLGQIVQGVQQIGQGGSPIQGAEAGLGIESGIASLITSPLAPLFAPVGQILNNIQEGKGAIGALNTAITSNPAVQNFANSQAGQAASRVLGNLVNAGNVAGTIAGVDQAVKTLPKVPEMIGNTINKGIDIVGGGGGGGGGKTDSSILSSYNKAVKPTVAGKTGPGQLDTYNSNVTSAIKSIAKNKDSLSFETDAGTDVGRLPQTRGELADAVAQTKKAIFSQYDNLTQQATGQGVRIPLEKAGNALTDVVNSEALKITNPKAVAYAKSVQDRISNSDGSFKTITPDIAQQVITNYNNSLKAFYRNPTYDNASQAAIDAGVAHEIRLALDETISKATGQNYQELKNQYGALSAIEKDVNKAAITQAKQTGTNTMGLGKYVDVFSGGDIVSGLLSLNPALFAKGIAQSGISHFFQWFNSPDRAVGSMFKDIQTNQPLLEPNTNQPMNMATPKNTIPNPTTKAPIKSSKKK